MTDTGLPDAVVDRLRAVFARYPLISQVLLYGSRAKGTWKPGSDIDLSIQGDPMSDASFASLLGELDELDLPWKIDLSQYELIDNPALRDHIERVGIRIYESDARNAQHCARQ